MLRWNLETCLRSSSSYGRASAGHWTRPSVLIASGQTLGQKPPVARIRAHVATQLRHIRQMTTPDLRKEFTEFFVKDHAHVPVKSSSLIPHNDKSLMFTNAGTNH
jgi:alanyl-tRNA synthetase